MRIGGKRMITKNYIKMCERAEEIQVKWKPRIGDTIKHRLTKSTQLITLYDIETYSDDFYIEEKYTWLPTQEQLQEMLKNSWADPSILLAEFYGWQVFIYPKFKDESITERWLAFVMKEKYNKVWTGEDWINEENTTT